MNELIAVMGLAITGLLAVIYRLRSTNQAYEAKGYGKAEKKCNDRIKLIHEAHRLKIENIYRTQEELIKNGTSIKSKHPDTKFRNPRLK